VEMPADVCTERTIKHGLYLSALVKLQQSFSKIQVQNVSTEKQYFCKKIAARKMLVKLTAGPDNFFLQIFIFSCPIFFQMELLTSRVTLLQRI